MYAKGQKLGGNRASVWREETAETGRKNRTYGHCSNPSIPASPNSFSCLILCKAFIELRLRNRSASRSEKKEVQPEVDMQGRCCANARQSRFGESEVETKGESIGKMERARERGKGEGGGGHVQTSSSQSDSPHSSSHNPYKTRTQPHSTPSDSTPSPRSNSRIRRRPRRRFRRRGRRRGGRVGRGGVCRLLGRGSGVSMYL